jgi:hypothetical protein
MNKKENNFQDQLTFIQHVLDVMPVLSIYTAYLI